MRLPWVVLKLLSGPTLEQEISQRRQQARHWSARELEEIFDPILDGLAFAHGRGIMHRDIKPSNVLLSRAASGKLEPKLVDFGTARTQLSVFEPSIGKTGFTPMYGAPEQWDKSIGPPSPATDVYALGLTLLECASLQRPHGSADSLPAIMRAVMGGGGGRGLMQVRPDLPPAFAGVVERALAVQPSQRFRDATELRAAVRDALSGAGAVARASASPSGVSASASPMSPTLGYRTTAPFVASHAGPAPSSSSSHGIIAIVLAALALVVVVGAAGVAAALYFRSVPREGGGGPTSASPSLVGARAISPPNVRSSEEFDRADAVAVTQKNHGAIEACAAKSHRFNGTIDVVLAAELCACVQGATAKWKFKPPKPEVAMPIFGEDTVWLHVHYVAAR